MIDTIRGSKLLNEEMANIINSVFDNEQWTVNTAGYWVCAPMVMEITRLNLVPQGRAKYV